MSHINITYYCCTWDYIIFSTIVSDIRYNIFKDNETTAMYLLSFMPLPHHHAHPLTPSQGHSCFFMIQTYTSQDRNPNMLPHIASDIWRHKGRWTANYSENIRRRGDGGNIRGQEDDGNIRRQEDGENIKRREDGENIRFHGDGGGGFKVSYVGKMVGGGLGSERITTLQNSTDRE